MKRAEKAEPVRAESATRVGLRTSWKLRNGESEVRTGAIHEVSTMKCSLKGRELSGSRGQWDL